MKPYTTVYVKPLIRKNRIIGWTWELLSGGKLLAYDDTPHETISLAREAGLSRTNTMTYPGSMVEWEKFWHDTLEEEIGNGGHRTA